MSDVESPGYSDVGLWTLDLRFSTMLHIHNGDASANTVRQSSLPGEHFAFREALIDGPTPAGIDGAEWRIVRARHLWAAYGVDLKECGKELLGQEMKLASFEQHDEVVLWFEHDLFCQLHLLYLLDWFSQHDFGKTKFSLICINEFPEKKDFRGLGELTAQQLASLFPSRQQVTAQQVNLGVAAWHAYRSPDPTAIENVLAGDTSALPFLRAALQAHLKRFPSTWNGLGRIENLALELVHAGQNSFIDLFQRFGDMEPVYGFGDAQFWFALRRLSSARQPLLAIASASSSPNEQSLQAPTHAVEPKARIEITKLGESTLSGATDFEALHGIDLWLGGVHLHDQNNSWRWDEGSGKLVSTSG